MICKQLILNTDSNGNLSGSIGSNDYFEKRVSYISVFANTSNTSQIPTLQIFNQGVLEGISNNALNDVGEGSINWSSGTDLSFVGQNFPASIQVIIGIFYEVIK